MNNNSTFQTESQYCIILESPCSKTSYAAAELRKYIYQLSGMVASITSEHHYGKELTFILQLNKTETGLGDEGYEIHTLDNNHTLIISADHSQGLLYGVYGLLDDHYGIGFYFSGDAIPQKKEPLQIMEIHERKIPEQYIRGVLPWTNFPQSATSYSLQDWIFMIDQMTRMRMNFINIHNYNGEFGHNEMFHNIMLGDKMSRNWNATASKPHAWAIKGWDVNEYLFGASDLFDDYDFGTDATLHNDYINNIDVFKKGSSQFQFILHYAHQRGVKIGLGLDLNLVMTDYQASADQDEVALARVNQIITDYPNLDYLMLYRSENSPNFDVWNKAFRITYDMIKQKASNIRITVSGWGLDPDTIINLPKDIIAAPISGHGINDIFPDGNIYGEREFWACPWSERDYHDSVHFAPYHTLLSNTIRSYQNRSSNTKGLMTLTWRVSDGVDAKLSYIAKAPWDHENKLDSSKAAYYSYAEKCYGREAAELITGIINENEAYATPASECVATPEFTNKDRSIDIEKANQQLAIIDSVIAANTDISEITRLKRLRSRIQSVKSFCMIDQSFYSTEWDELNKEFQTFVENFISRVDDISTLGNIISIENRYVKERYLARECELRNSQSVKSPSAVVVKNTASGARITWKNEQPSAIGFNIYRNNKKLNETLVNEEFFEDHFDGEATYRVTAVSANEEESIGSIPVSCQAGSSKSSPLQVIVVSPPTVISSQNFIDLKAIVIDSTISEQITAKLYYRSIGSKQWQSLPMERRIKGIFGIRLAVNNLPQGDIEYYIEACDGRNIGHYPEAAPTLCSIISMVKSNHNPLSAPVLTKAENGRIYWTPSDGNIHWYRIYRGLTPDFQTGPQSLVTYVYRDTLSFKDTQQGFDGKPLCGNYYYKVTAVDINLYESSDSEPILCKITPPEKYSLSSDLLAPNTITELTSENPCIHLCSVDFGTGEHKQILFDYASTGVADITLWIDGESNENGGIKIGHGRLSTSGGMSITQIGEIRISNVRGIHNVFVSASIDESSKCRLDSFWFENILNNEVIITTESDAFSINTEQDPIRLHANQKVTWEVKELNGSPANDALINDNGVLQYRGHNNIRVVAKSDSSIIGERLITTIKPVSENISVPFHDFGIISSLIGKDEAVEIGGLIYGYDYACRIIENDMIVYDIDFSSTMSFKIPPTILSEGHQYQIVVAAKDQNGNITEAVKDLHVSDCGLTNLNVTSDEGGFMFKKNRGISEFGTYQITSDGVCIKTESGSSLTGINFTLDPIDINKTPFLLVKAEKISGDWTLRVNGIPIVGPKENNIAVRKDLRIFGLQNCNAIDICLIVTTPHKETVAETIFKTIQLLAAE